jgi:hypothetical protein
MNFGTSDAASFAYAFPFDTLSNATLELWLNPNAVPDWDLIWTTTTPGDTNRFNIHWGGGQFCVDYREPNVTIHGLGCSAGGTVPAGQWSFIAFVKQGNVYSIYVNSSATGNVTTLSSQVTDTAPNLPTSTSWTINGRCALNGQSCSGAGLLDEIRLSNNALSPSGFLVALPIVPFHAFSAKLQIAFGSAPNQDSFDLKSSFTLSSTAPAINPPTQAVTLQVGTFTVTIPAGSFKKNTKGYFSFAGVIGGVSLQVLIKPTVTLSYAFQAEATGASLAGTTNPVQVTLTIGDDSSTASVTAQISR